MARRRSGAVAFDAKKFERSLRDGLREVGADAEKVMGEAATKIRDTAKAKAPVRTGKLQRSIRMRKGATKARGVYWDVGTRLVYAPVVEFGRDGKAAHPFLRAAFAEVGAELGSGTATTDPRPGG